MNAYICSSCSLCDFKYIYLLVLLLKFYVQININKCDIYICDVLAVIKKKNT